MNRKIGSSLVYVLIGLAVVGFATALINDTVGLLSSLLISLLIGAAIFGLVYFFLMRKRSTDELKKYRKAVKQSKQRYKTQQSNFKTKSSALKPNFSTKKAIRPLKSSNRSATHLRVIEGNKQKNKKNRASL
ncbi:hypothetical protein MUN88_15575 [Gracilibacillus caseinilyticus]|uniref:Uncharacterized protein n=1 Tax=Gracilibacillus caseinilyticus TaxID=2932256 RepID=A0ABY4EZ76_9BACI|nr:SA1362 family protein [Gracilibacillus caseinilyticus]UOQ47471.1 hypothetical protein MUN88_15575 [Gracilibacillus caseinilyticus]